jgi:hypothetical protein
LGYFKKGEFDKLAVVGKQRIKTQISEFKRGELDGYTIRLVNRRSDSKILELYEHGELKFLTNLDEEE